MSKKANPTLVGAFVIGALLLAFVAVMTLARGSLFHRTERAVMYFEGSVYGLQVGAPVVFLGVKVGQVAKLGITVSPETKKYLIPVVVEFSPEAEKRLRSTGVADLDGMRRLGLRAQLQSQSLLTGLLMVDLSLQPKTPERLYGLSNEMGEIPTLPSRFDQMTARLEQLPIEDMIADLGSTMAALKTLVNSPELKTLIGNAGGTMASLKRTLVAIERLELQIEKQAVLPRAAESLAAMQQAADKTGAAMDSLSQLSAENSSTLKSLREGVAEVGAAARSLRDLSTRDSTAVWQLEQTARELENTALSLRQLSDTVESKPEVLIWGRKSKPAAEAPPSTQNRKAEQP
ncbi:paraquat-inducible protein B [Paucibacter oligotrophus]|uniref:Paraquat-inducible protein B n=1 Tax=Roseateles oligotrophus TaxID=1769250 RepID=A0A840LDK4_9BURK|nr:MlaD family protein [Roseateles oligotrophus]MBB4846250.1 paraquat-inducible protein B [Roseateles oligotrophus]